MKKKNKKGFTLAEVLITLSIIGVVAAILFPSILANFTEKTLNAKRQALFGRMSQAMGGMVEQFRNYSDADCTNNNDLTTCTDKGSALKFINEGLSKAYKISAVCDSDNLSACDIPEEVFREDNSVFLLRTNGSSLVSYNPQIQPYKDGLSFDTKSAAFMTKNGESILLFYNPGCSGKMSFRGESYGYLYSEALMCINMVYDLNGGKQKPNRVGKDIGFISVFYNDSPSTASARPYDWKAIPDYDSTTDITGEIIPLETTAYTFEEAKAACQRLGDNVGLPSREEAMAMQINRELWAPISSQKSSFNSSGVTITNKWMWTGTGSYGNYAWMYNLTSDDDTTNSEKGSLRTRLDPDTTEDVGVRCVYKD